MNNNAKKWIEALKSDKYTQTSGNLRDKQGYCCLGVLCEVYNENVKKPIKAIFDRKTASYTYDNNDAFPPLKVSKWVDLKDGADDILTTYNDIRKFTFKKIASILEKKPDEFFKK